MKKKNKRLFTILIFMALFHLDVRFCYQFERKLNFFYSPTEVFEKQIDNTQMIRVGGMVKDESLVKKLKQLKEDNLKKYLLS